MSKYLKRLAVSNKQLKIQYKSVCFHYVIYRERDEVMPKLSFRASPVIPVFLFFFFLSLNPVTPCCQHMSKPSAVSDWMVWIGHHVNPPSFTALCLYGHVKEGRVEAWRLICRNSGWPAKRHSPLRSSTLFLFPLSNLAQRANGAMAERSLHYPPGLQWDAGSS